MSHCISPEIATPAMQWTVACVFGVVAFLLGSIPTGFLVVKAKTGQDIRKTGSGNIGATNVSRVLGKPWGVTVFVLDAFKGAAAVQLCLLIDGYSYACPPSLEPWTSTLFPWVFHIAVIAPVAGHCFSPWLNWNGGKGVAVAAGVFVTLLPKGVALAIAVYLAVALTTHVSAAGSLAARASFLVYVHMSKSGLMLMALGVAALLIFRHRSNIRQMLEKRRSA